MLKIFDLKSLPIEIIDEKHIYKNAKKEHYEFTFDFYDSKQFKKLVDCYEAENDKKLKKLQETNPDATKEDVADWVHTEDFVIGNVSLFERVKDEDLEKAKQDNDDELTVLKMDILELEDKDSDYEQYDSYFKVNAPANTSTYGYVRVGKYEYIRIEEGEAAAILVKGGKAKRLLKRGGKFIVLTILLSCLIGGGLKMYNDGVTDWDSLVRWVNIKMHGVEKEDNSDKVIGEGENWDGTLIQNEEQSVSPDYIQVAGYSNLFCSEAQPNIRLINPGTLLQTYQEYVISLDGEEIYRTELIQPKQEIIWNAYETLTDLNLEKGTTYWFTFKINNFAINEDGSVGGLLNGANEKVDLTLK